MAKLGDLGRKVVAVYPYEPLCNLINYLEIKDENVKLIFQGMTYMVNTLRTFEEIGLTKDSIISLVNQALAG